MPIGGCRTGVRWVNACRTGGFAAVLIVSLATAGPRFSGEAEAGAARAQAGVREFRRDPGWESFRSRLVPVPAPLTRQDFGYAPAVTVGGGARGAVGGRVQRSLYRASYARAIPTRTLEDRLSARGRFTVNQDDGGSGILFGWFHADSRGWRTPNSLVFRLDGNGSKFWVFFEYGTRNWLTGGRGCFEGEQYQTTPTRPFPADGAPHEFDLEYDPAGEAGRGEIRFTLDGRRYRLPLAPGHRLEGATFNRFGILNQMTSGGGMEAYFSDLVVAGERIALDRDPGWSGEGNRRTFLDGARRPLHDFGWSRTHHAGKATGEIGGLIWRDEQPAYYADRVGPLTLDQPLRASGSLSFQAAGSDSAVLLGWFDGAAKRDKQTPEHQERQRNVLAILLEGPSRIGHYFRPAVRNGPGNGRDAETGPILKPDGRRHFWRMEYDPAGAGGKGVVRVTLDGAEERLELPPGVRAAGARFDRFGICNVQSGGHHVELYVDDLTYTGQR